MMRAYVLILLLTGVAIAQVRSEPQFEVVSVKLNSGDQGNTLMTGGPGTADPGRIAYHNVSLRSVVCTAYGIAPIQIVNAAVLGDAETYDITAIVPAGANIAQFRVMLQNLLKDRFHLEAESEARTVTGYVLTVGPGQSVRLAKTVNHLGSNASGNGDTPAAPRFALSVGGGPAGPVGHLIATSQSISQLVRFLDSELHALVEDETHLTALYDFTLDFAMEQGGAMIAQGDSRTDIANNEGPPDLRAALQEQLGLKLISRKLTQDMLFIRHVNKVPSAN